MSEHMGSIGKAALPARMTVNEYPKVQEELRVSLNATRDRLAFLASRFHGHTAADPQPQGEPSRPTLEQEIRDGFFALQRIRAEIDDEVERLESAIGVSFLKSEAPPPTMRRVG